MFVHMVGLVGLMLTLIWFARLALCAVQGPRSRARSIAFGGLGAMAVLSSITFTVLRHLGSG